MIILPLSVFKNNKYYLNCITNYLGSSEYYCYLGMEGKIGIVRNDQNNVYNISFQGLFEDGSKISLKSWQNKYVVAESNEQANADSDSVQIWTVVARPGIFLKIC